MDLLERRGAAILAIELEGALFFGSAERLATEIELAARGDVRVVVLDLRRVTDIDSTGAEIIRGIREALTQSGKHLALALHRQGEIAARLEGLGALGESAAFDDVDRAIEWSEDILLREEDLGSDVETEIALAEVGVLRDFDENELATLARHLKRASYAKGSLVFAEGDRGRDLFIILRGRASAYLRQDGGRAIRLVTFGAGTIFGEQAILDAGPRSASISADSDLTCCVLSEADFAALSGESAALAIKLLAGLGRMLSARLRRANRTIHQLEA